MSELDKKKKKTKSITASGTVRGHSMTLQYSWTKGNLFNDHLPLVHRVLAGMICEVMEVPASGKFKLEYENSKLMELEVTII